MKTATAKKVFLAAAERVAGGSAPLVPGFTCNEVELAAHFLGASELQASQLRRLYAFWLAPSPEERDDGPQWAVVDRGDPLHWSDFGDPYKDPDGEFRNHRVMALLTAAESGLFDDWEAA
jgi:hypothetical protein